MVLRAEDLVGSKLIPDLATWLQCFSIYMVVVTDTEPDRAKSLLAYMTTIAKASIKYTWPSWTVYDQNYRQEAADNDFKDWSKVDPNIYTQCFTNAATSRESWCQLCQSIDHGHKCMACDQFGHPHSRCSEAKKNTTKSGSQDSHSNSNAVNIVIKEVTC